MLGWTVKPGRVADGWQAPGVHLMARCSGPQPASERRADMDGGDIDAAVARVRAAGALAEPSRQPDDMSAECADDQGARCDLGQL